MLYQDLLPIGKAGNVFGHVLAPSAMHLRSGRVSDSLTVRPCLGAPSQLGGGNEEFEES